MSLSNRCQCTISYKEILYHLVFDLRSLFLLLLYNMSLTEVSFYFRKFLPLGIIFILVFFIFFYAIKLFFSTLENRPKPIRYNTVFGKIAPPTVPNATSSAGISFVLDTIEGRPISASASGYVYFLPPTATRFGYREKIYVMAKNLGFNTDIIKHKLIGKDAVFTDDKQTLTADITNFNFDYEYDYKKDPAVFEEVFIPDENRIKDSAIGFLKQVGRYPEELAQGKTNIIYFNYDQSENVLRVVERPQEANVVEVDFYRADIPGNPQAFPIVAPTYFNSPNHIIMVFKTGKMIPLKAEVSFYEKSKNQIGTYPLRSGEEAWEDLKAGNGYILHSNGYQSVTIKHMFLGYLDPSDYQNYLQPVYVFLGDGDFVAYVPAVSKKYLTE